VAFRRAAAAISLDGFSPPQLQLLLKHARMLNGILMNFDS
jgi:hypothetical protein